ncbi:MAG: c-type cytochrome [Proteobacteria bacterium]|nr:c-type cytochrome [Pseudomonadota bacterium]
MLKQKIASKKKSLWRTCLPYVVGIFSLIGTTAAAQSSSDMAEEEYEAALKLEPNLNNGRTLYGQCAVCHDPEGWGRRSGIYPQIAGQLPNVIIKQLADIRAGNRGNPMMYPFASGKILKTAQDITDVAAYVSQLPMTWDNGKGSHSRAKRGKPIYEQYCIDCHGKQGEGDNKEHIPMIQGQHYEYLIRQFEWIRIGRRQNADDEMIEQIQSFHSGEMYDVLSYVSHLPPPENKLAPDDWINPDFQKYSRDSEDQFRSSTQKLSIREQKKGLQKD